MLEDITKFLLMGGYGGYVFSAYFLVGIFLFWQWYAAWRPWKIFKKKLLVKNNKTKHVL